ncbi:DNA (cytosine-5)-methyltransferase 3B [Clarias magur]|uniref:DNA (Cytosine-5)-methyltransferase 3B n=1 Tax=Clarias magur TaxID=1594786 RepID=A0A8J4XH59_CLAMG|nr:DNA (cytosine-5)-methyltransferase 3B [Clarias magur]
MSNSSCVRCAWVQCIDVFAGPMGGCCMGNLELTFQPPTLSSSAGGETQRELLVHKQNLAKGPVAPWEAFASSVFTHWRGI